MQDMDQKISQTMMDFIQAHPSCYHVAEGLAQILEESGFERLYENERWELQAGRDYYVMRNGSSLIGFRIPEGAAGNFQIAASHSDSPSFKIKEHPEMKVAGHYIELNVEKYGGMLCAPWFDRPLSIAGRVMVRTDQGLETRTINFDRDLVMLPNLAIHMDRSLNDGYTYNAQKDMIPIWGDEKAEGTFLAMAAEQAGVEEKDLISTDLFLYNRMPGTIWGAHREYISSPHLDDVQCAYASIRALVEGGHRDSISVCSVFDNEEVGSATKQGAASGFLKDTLDRIADCLGKDAEDFRMMLSESFMISADNAHAAHPNHLDKADPTNRPYMNEGIVIKYNANQRYTTDAVSAAVFQEICRRADVPVQSYVNRSDVPGGSTLGNIASHQVSINMVDIGLAQLAMHSPYETAGVKDTSYLIRALREFYSTKISRCGDEKYQLL